MTLSPEVFAAIELAKISDQEWSVLTSNLLRFTSRRVKRLTWYGKKAGAMSGAKEVQDLVNDTILAVLLGEDRHWNPYKEPSLENYLRGVLNSKINHMVNSDEHKVFTDSALSAPSGHGDGGDGEPETGFLANQPTPEVSVRESLDAEAFYEGLLEHLKDDPEAQQVLECHKAGFARPQEIAELLNKSAKEMYNITKRFRRKADEFLKIWQKREGGGT